MIDQRVLPHQFETLTLRTMEECAEAIRNMTVRGAPLIGATAAYWHVHWPCAMTLPSDAGFGRRISGASQNPPHGD